MTIIYIQSFALQIDYAVTSMKLIKYYVYVKPTKQIQSFNEFIFEGHICYNCADISHPRFCNHVKQCSIGQVIHITM